MHLIRCLIVSLMALGLSGCGWIVPSVGYRIPGTPVSLGVGIPIPLGKSSGKAGAVVYRPLVVESQPAGAEIYVNDTLVGSTPMTAMVPFEKGVWGGAKGSAQLVVKRPGYLPEGQRVFAVKGSQISQRPAGEPVTRLTFHLRPATSPPGL